MQTEEKNNELNKYSKECCDSKSYFFPNKKENLISAAFKIDSISNALDCFFEREVLGDLDNMFDCKICKKKVPYALREFYLNTPPKVLVLHLKRFTGKSYMIQKLSKKIEIEETIFLDDYICFESRLT